ncbi:oxidoreductase-like protein [Xylariaceae sp. FL0594]|nr:oxidoreductase-like protein [Xylariaceae sp. FL0594]
MATEREGLTARVMPQMTLGSGAPGSLTAPPPPFPRHRDMSPAERACERFRVKGNAIVTGGAGDLGSAVSKALLEHGVQGLMIFDVNPAEAEAKVQALAGEFPQVSIRFLKVDITDEAEVDAAVSETVELLGPVTTLLNFAGMVSCGHALDWTALDWNRVMSVNTVGGFLVARAVARHMIERKLGGSIIFVASVSAHRVNFPQPQAPYNVSKAGVKAMAQSLAAEWAQYGIRVNSISPGYMDTILNEGDGLDTARRTWLSRHPLGRMGQPDELSGVVVMLASRAGSYFNGSDLLVDGGQTLFM